MSHDPIVEAYWRGRFDESDAVKGKIEKVVWVVVAVAFFPITIPVCLWIGSVSAVEHIRGWIWARKHPTEFKHEKEKAEKDKMQHEQDKIRQRAYGGWPPTYAELGVARLCRKMMLRRFYSQPPPDDEVNVEDFYRKLCEADCEEEHPTTSEERQSRELQSRISSAESFLNWRSDDFECVNRIRANAISQSLSDEDYLKLLQVEIARVKAK